jgi:hypothetical protein
MIDWYKQIESVSEHIREPRVLEVYSGGRALVAFYAGEERSAKVFRDDTSVFRNLQPKPREGWVPHHALNLTKDQARVYWGVRADELLVLVREVLP